MRNRFFVLLFVTFIFVGCNNKQPQPSGATSDGAAATTPSLGIPMPTAEILSALGPENDIPIQRLLANPLFAVVGKPKQFLASPVSAGGEQLVSDIIANMLQLYHVSPGDIEWFVQSTGFPLLIPAPQDPDNPPPPQQQRVIPVARRATIITFNKSLDAETMLKQIDDPVDLASKKRTVGTTEYYDLTPPGFPLHVAFGLYGDKSAVFVEGTAEDVQSVFSDTVLQNAVLERLKHTPVDANELTLISSLEGLPIKPEAFEDLLDKVGGNLPSGILSLVKQNIRALSLSMNVSTAVGQPIVSICIEGRDEKSAETIRDTIQGLLLNVKTTMATMSEEAKQALPIPADLAAALLKEMSVAVKGTQVNVTLNNYATLIPTVAEYLRDSQVTMERDRLQQGRMGQLMGHWALFMKYYQEHQKFPADILDADGNPLLSWRVALLPLMQGGEELYSKFKLNEPWNSEANLAVLNSPDLRPAIFYPQVEGVDSSKTVIRFFNSSGTPFSKRDLKAEDIKSPENTLMFVMVTPKYAVEWTKPDSLEFDINNVADMLGTPQFWGVSFAGQILGPAVVPNTDPKYDEWKQYIEALVKALPAE